MLPLERCPLAVTNASLGVACVREWPSDTPARPSESVVVVAMNYRTASTAAAEAPSNKLRWLRELADKGLRVIVYAESFEGVPRHPHWILIETGMPRGHVRYECEVYLTHILLFWRALHRLTFFVQDHQHRPGLGDSIARIAKAKAGRPPEYMPLGAFGGGAAVGSSCVGGSAEKIRHQRAALAALGRRDYGLLTQKDVWLNRWQSSTMPRAVPFWTSGMFVVSSRRIRESVSLSNRPLPLISECMITNR